MILIQISKWLDKTFTENLYEKHYKKNIRACVLKKTVLSGDYMEYSVARVPWDGEEIPEGYAVETVENDRIKIEVLKSKN
jgi:hypothetical protein